MDAKDVMILIKRVVAFSFSSFCKLAQKYPLASGIFLSSLSLYLFLPSIFYFLAFVSPFVVCTAVFILFYFNSRSPELQTSFKNKKDDEVSSLSEEPKSLVGDVVVGSNERPSSNFQAMSQRKWRKEEPVIAAVPATTPDPDLIDRTSLVEEKPKVLVEEKNKDARYPDHGESSSQSEPRSEGIAVPGKTSEPEENVGEAELESSSSDDEEEDEEEAKEGVTKAVEWNEDDEKNLMDLGDSELERNRRLESLIARRRSRKSFKLNTVVERSVIDTDGNVPGFVVPLNVSRSNPFDVPDNREDQVPGSAPSILHQRRNPFDLPYDPLEEKPNLTADSFHQEFMAAHQKDVYFCRHESFSLGPYFPYFSVQDQNDSSGFFRYPRHSGSNEDESFGRTLSITDLVTEAGQSPNQEVRKSEENIAENNSSPIEATVGQIQDLNSLDPTAINRQNSDSSQSSSSSDDNEKSLGVINIGTTENSDLAAFKFPEMNIAAPTPLHCPIPKARTTISPPRSRARPTSEKPRPEAAPLNSVMSWHTPTNSLSSDMQVEVSEGGSPPLTVDGSASSSDGDSYTYDGDIEKEITSGSDDMWGVSPHAPVQRSREHEMGFGFVNDVGYSEAFNGGDSGIKAESEEPRMPITSFQSLPKAKEPQESEATSSKCPLDGVKQAVEVEENRLPRTSGEHPPGNSEEGPSSIQEPLSRPLDRSHLQEPQQSSSSPVKSAEEINISYGVDDMVHHNDDVEDTMPTEQGVGGSESLAPVNNLKQPTNAPEDSTVEVTTDQNVEDPAVPATNHVAVSKLDDEKDVANGKLTIEESAGDQSKLPQEPSTRNASSDHSVLESETQDEESTLLNPIGNSGEDSYKSANTKDARENPRCDGVETTELAGNSQEEQSTGVSSLNQTYTDPGILQREEVIFDQVQDDNSSSSSSPKSVLPDRIPADDITSPDISVHRAIYISDSDVEESAVRRNLLEVLLPDQRPPPSLPRPPSQVIQEPSNGQGRLTGEANNKTDFVNAPEITEDVQAQSIETISNMPETSSSNLVAKISTNPHRVPAENGTGAIANGHDQEPEMKQPEQRQEQSPLDTEVKTKVEDAQEGPSPDYGLAGESTNQ